MTYRKINSGIYSFFNIYGVCLSADQLNAKTPPSHRKLSNLILKFKCVSPLQIRLLKSYLAHLDRVISQLVTICPFEAVTVNNHFLFNYLLIFLFIIKCIRIF